MKRHTAGKFPNDINASCDMDFKHNDEVQQRDLIMAYRQNIELSKEEASQRVED